MAEQNFMSDPMSTPVGEGSNTAPYLPYHDLRQWLEEAKKFGEVKEVGGLSYQRDIGMVAEMSAHADDAPCFVFEDVPGTLQGSRLMVNFFAGKRKNMTLGFSTELSKLELSDGLTGDSINPVGRPLTSFPYLGVPYDGYDFPPPA